MNLWLIRKAKGQKFSENAKLANSQIEKTKLAFLNNILKK